MTAEFDEVKLVNLATGKEFVFWESVTVESDFTTPCDKFSVDAGAEVATPELAKQFPMGAPVQVLVNDKPQLTGHVKRCKLTCNRGGSRLNVTGYDILFPLVRGNLNPRIAIPKETTIRDLCKLVITEQFGLPYSIVDTDGAAEIAIGSGTGKKKKYESRHKRELGVKDIKPHDGEGAFGYLSRILSHYGYWLWAQADGRAVVVAGPDYDQATSYELIRRHDPGGNLGVGIGNNILDGTADHNEEDTPSHVFVRGSDASAGAKGAVKAMASSPLVSGFVPSYIADRDASTKEKAETIARRSMAKQMRNWFSYDCTVAGLSQRTGDLRGNVYNVNTVADVTDEKTGTRGKMWIENRSFRKSRGGTETTLKLIPLGTLVLDWQPDEKVASVLVFTDAAAIAGAQAPGKTGKFESGEELSFFETQK